MSSPIHLTIHPGDDAPIYRQIARQVREAIAVERLVSGDRLPSHRELAQRLVVSPLTVKKAYDDLEREGLIRTARGQGTFVAERPAGMARAEARESLRPAARRLVGEARLLGLADSEVDALLSEERARLVQEEGKEQEASR